MRPTFLLLAFASVVASAACHKDSTSPDTGTGGGGGSTPIVYTLYVDTLLPDTVTSTVATAVPVRAVLTKEGLPVPNSKVAWKISVGSGAVSSDTTITDADGVASVTWTLGDTAGFNSLSITAFDAATSYTAFGTPSSATLVTRVTSDSSAVIAGAALPLQVRVFDRFGNGATGTAIQWTATGGSLTITNATTGSNGGSATVFTTPSTAGTYNVTATLPGRSSVTFKIVAL